MKLKKIDMKFNQIKTDINKVTTLHSEHFDNFNTYFNNKITNLETETTERDSTYRRSRMRTAQS